MRFIASISEFPHGSNPAVNLTPGQEGQYTISLFRLKLLRAADAEALLM